MQPLGFAARFVAPVMIAKSFHSPVATPLLCLGLLALAWGCKPAPAPNPIEKPQAAEPPGQTPGNSRRAPSTNDLASFLRGVFPAGAVRVVDVKNDPPVPLPNASPGTNAWLLTVRLTLAPAEDLLLPMPAQDTEVLQARLVELHGLVDWSQTYARSPYTDLGPTFTVNVPGPARTTAPQLLHIVHPREQPLAPLYGKVAAEWQVDRWQFSVLDLSAPDDQSKPRGWFQGPTLIQGSREASHFLGEVQTALDEAKEHQAAIERRYQESLAEATRPGTLYRGELQLRSNGFKKNPVPVEVRFVDVAPGGADAHQAQFNLKLPQSPGDDFSFRVKLADHLPLVLPAQARQFPSDVTSLGDVTISGSRAAGKDDMGASLAGLLLSGLHSGMTPGNAPLFAHNRRLAGALATTLVGDLWISTAQAP